MTAEQATICLEQPKKERQVFVPFRGMMEGVFPKIPETVFKIGEELLDVMAPYCVEDESGPIIHNRGSVNPRYWLGTPPGFLGVKASLRRYGEGYMSIDPLGKAVIEALQAGPNDADVMFEKPPGRSDEEIIRQVSDWIVGKNPEIMEKGWSMTLNQTPLAIWNGWQDRRIYFQLIVNQRGKNGSWKSLFRYDCGETVGPEDLKRDGRYSELMTTYDMTTGRLVKRDGVWELGYNKNLCELVFGRDPVIIRPEGLLVPPHLDLVSRVRLTNQILFYSRNPLIRFANGTVITDYTFQPEIDDHLGLLPRREVDLVTGAMVGLSFNPLAWFIVAERTGILPLTKLGQDLFDENNTYVNFLEKLVMEGFEEQLYSCPLYQMNEFRPKGAGARWGWQLVLDALREVGLGKYNTLLSLMYGVNVVEYAKSQCQPWLR